MVIYLATGCYWKTEHVIKGFDGVLDTEIGLAYPELDQEAVEAVRVDFDPGQVSLRELIERFLDFANPLKPDRKGGRWSKYRTGIYWNPGDAASAKIVLETLDDLEQRLLQASDEDAIAFTVEACPIHRFEEADERYQDYLEKHPHIFC